MKPAPLISIALCTYNGEKYLVEQLETLINQTYKNIEIVVVDDCSMDNTVGILKKYEAEGKVFLYQNKENLGFVKNFEKAISLCKGEFISLSDQDDIWKFDKIEKLLNNIGDHLMIYHDSELVDSQCNSLNKKTSDFTNFVKGNNNKAFIFCNCVSGHAMLFKKELTNYIFPLPAKFYHDWWMAYAASTIGEITFLKEPLAKYRQHEKSFTDIMKLREEDETLKVKRSSKIASPEQRKAKTEKTIALLQMFYQFRHNKENDKRFLEKLIKLYLKREESIFCFRLYITLMKNINTLFFIDKDPIGRMIYIFRESVGHKVKNKFHFYRNNIVNKFKKIFIAS